MRRAGVALGIAAALALAAPAAAQEQAPAGFVSLKAEAPSIVIEMRYLTAHNFIGRPIKRLPRPAVHRHARDRRGAGSRRRRPCAREGYTLKVYDCYRPQRAVDDFVAWGKRLGDQRMKAEFYPRVDKRDVFKEGYIAEKSGHSRGSTVDLTLVRRPAARQERYERGDRLRDCAAPRSRRFRDNSIDMGTGYDCFDPLSHPYNARVTGKQRAQPAEAAAGDARAGLQGARDGVVALHAARRALPRDVLRLPRQPRRPGRLTSSANSRSSSPAGSPVRPVCTGEGCTIVLDGAVSQWKRSDCGIVATCPPSGRPSATATSVSSCARTSAGSQPGRERGQQRLVELDAGAEEAQRAAEQHHAGVDGLAALDARDDAHHRVLERLSARAPSASSTNPARSSSRAARWAA